MSVIERDLTHFEYLGEKLEAGTEIAAFVLDGPPDRETLETFEWRLEFPLSNAYRILCCDGTTRQRPLHDNANAPGPFYKFKVLELNEERRTAVFAFPEPSPESGFNENLQLRLDWSYQISLEVWHVEDAQTNRAVPVVRDLRTRSYALTQNGMMRHWMLDRTRVHLGLGEKAAPIDLTGRSFAIHATDAALYDSYRTDPLYKHTPFLISTPRPSAEGKQGLSYGIFHATNSVATWDVGGEIDYPSGGWSKRYIQHHGGLEEWVMIGQGVKGVVETYARIVGRPKLVGRSWLGYLASTMQLADQENAQEALEQWPELCRRYDIPCSAMHLSSGYTVDEKSGARWVFYLNKKRYPDIKKMVQTFHSAGMKIIPNVKPYVLVTHPHYAMLKAGNGLFHDSFWRGHSRQNMWSGGMGESGDGSWVDFTAPEARKWWADGVDFLIDQGFDGIWDDNNEFYLRDDFITCCNDLDGFHQPEVSTPARNIPIGLMGRIKGNELMNKISHDRLLAAHPRKRPFVLTRSANPAAFKYACATWSGDNLTSWHNMRGSQHVQLGSAVSLIHHTGADVGGFGGDIPSPELLVRWVQLGVTHSRFCIHSAPSDTRGRPKLNSPWMYPEVLPIVREHIKWRYTVLPFLYHLTLRSHSHAEPINAPLFYGPFAADPVLYTDKVLEGFDAWLGVGQLLVAPQLFEGGRTREVYLPKSSSDDRSLYFDLHPPYAHREAGSWVTVDTPLEHGSLWAREGALVPVGKDAVTIVEEQGDHDAKYATGDDELEIDRDDFRGVLVFPGFKGAVHSGHWVEDDGESVDPALRCVVNVTYSDEGDTVRVDAELSANGFRPLWAETGVLHIILPAGDERTVVGRGAEKRRWKERDVWAVGLAINEGKLSMMV